jgi:putative ABC transport system permease protein
MNGAIHNHWSAVKNELLRTGVISRVSRNPEAPMTQIGNSTSGFSWPGKDPGFSIDFQFDQISYDYGKTVGWESKRRVGISHRSF